MINDIYRHFALVGFLVYWTASLYMVHRWWGGRDVTFSLHAASNKSARKLFAAAVTVETILYLLFAFKWFIPHYDMPFIFGVFISLTAAGHLIAGLIPETKGASRWIHRKASYGSVVLFIPELLIIGFTQSVSGFVRIVAIIFALMLIWAWYQFLFKLNRREDIVNQAIYIATLPLVFILAAYIC